MTHTGPWVSACFLVPNFSHTWPDFQLPTAVNAHGQFLLFYSYWSKKICSGVWDADWSSNYVQWETRKSRCDCEIHAVAKAQALLLLSLLTQRSFWWRHTTSLTLHNRLVSMLATKNVVTLWLTPGNCRVKNTVRLLHNIGMLTKKGTVQMFSMF